MAHCCIPSVSHILYGGISYVPSILSNEWEGQQISIESRLWRNFITDIGIHMSTILLWVLLWCTPKVFLFIHCRGSLFGSIYSLHIWFHSYRKVEESQGNYVWITWIICRNTISSLISKIVIHNKYLGYTHWRAVITYHSMKPLCIIYWWAPVIWEDWQFTFLDSQNAWNLVGLISL